MYLAAAGVGTLGIVDFDTVDESNLQRQIIHGVSPTSAGPRPSRRGDSIAEINPLRQRAILQRGAAGPRQRPGDLRPVRPDRRRHRQLRHPLPGQRRVRAARQAVRLGLDLPLRRPGLGLLGRARPLLPLPLPGAAAARHGPLLRRGRRARRALRVDRLDPGHRGDQAAHRHRRAAGRPADGLRRPGDDLPQDQGPQGPELRGLRREPDRHRADRLRGVLRRGLGRGRRRRPSTRRSPRWSSRP